jgi:Domain of unknown function (DUF4352)
MSEPGSEAAKGSAKRIVGAVVFVVIMAGLIGIATYGGSSSNSSNKQPPSAAASSNDSASSSAPASNSVTINPSPPGLNQPADDGKSEFVVSALKCGQHYLVNDNQFENATAQGQFCVLSVGIKNIGSVAQTFDYSAQFLNDATPSVYSASSDGTEAANPSGSRCWSYASINPGVSQSCNVAFDVPASFQAVGAVLHDSSVSDGVKVALQ